MLPFGSHSGPPGTEDRVWVSRLYGHLRTQAHADADGDSPEPLVYIHSEVVDWKHTHSVANARCRVNTAHVRQSWPKVLETFQVVRSSLGSG